MNETPARDRRILQHEWKEGCNGAGTVLECSKHGEKGRASSITGWNTVAVENSGSNNSDHRRGPFRSIRAKLIVYFSLMFVLVMAAAELFSIFGIWGTPYSGHLKQTKAEVLNGLELVADLKKERLLRWLEERRDDARVWADSPMMRKAVSRLREAMRRFSAQGRQGEAFWALVRDEPNNRALLESLEKIQTSHEVYERLQVADATTSEVFVSTIDADLGKAVSGTVAFTQALESDDVGISDVEADPQVNKPHFHLSHAIRDEDGETTAVLVMTIHCDDIIRPLLHAGKALGLDGEALLVNRDVKILTSLKHPLADGRFALPLRYTIDAEPARRAAAGKAGIIESDDYRGEPVLAAYRYIPVTSGSITADWGWGMVVKRDREEVFAPIRQELRYSILIGVIGILAVIALTYLTASNLSRPIHGLSETARRVEAGDLRARAPVTAADDVGALATTFNSMVQRVQDWREELEEEVRARTADLEAKNAELEQYSYTVSHDLKSPLITIKGFAGLLERDLADGDAERVKVDIEHITVAAARMLRLLDELLALSRAGRQVNPPEESAFRDLAQEAADMAAGRIVERGIRVEIAEDSPIVFCDRRRTLEVIQNLVDNAAKFMGDQVEPRIEIGARLDGAENVCYVRDNGVGIDPRYHKKVFDLFGQLDPDFEGTGLGLALVRRIVEVHGGRVWVESDGAGEGSTFFFTLPTRERSPLGRRDHT